MAFNESRIVSHYIKVSQNFRDGNITAQQVEDILSRDAQSYLAMKNKGLLTEMEFNSVLVIMNEFEDLFVEIGALKKELNNRQNGRT